LKLRKHSVALVALGVFHFVFFFPVIFMGRTVSPNDVYRNYDPWSFTRQAATQNSLLNDPPMSYYTLMSLAKYDHAAFHWNPFVASGIPGWGSSAAAVLSPFIILPVVSVPLPWVYTAIIFLKLNVAFWLGYLWLRQERLGKGGAAIGALVVAAAGVISVRWLWQSTNATALYPGLLWCIRRAFDGKRNSMAAMIVLALAYALAGFPAAMAYGAYIAVAYALFLGGQAILPVRGRGQAGLRGQPGLRGQAGLPVLQIAGGAIAAGIALMIAAPSLVPMIQLVKRTGYLATRERVSIDYAFPLAHARLFLFPDALGSNSYKNWIGDPRLGALNNYYESTIYLGALALALALIGVFARRARWRWFWLATFAVLVAAIFGGARFLGYLPGLKYSWLTRMSILLPLPAGYLAAAGTSLIARKRFAPYIAMLIAVLVAGDLGLFAGRFYPYLDPAVAEVPATPTIAFLQSQPRPYRIAPMMNYLWPNSAELFRLEDVRSHFSSEAEYRQILQRVDPSAWGGTSTVLVFDSRYFNFADPFVGMLGVRYFIEHKAIDIIKWTTFKETKPGVEERGVLKLAPGGIAMRTVTVDAKPFWAIELPVGLVIPSVVEGPAGAGGAPNMPQAARRRPPRSLDYARDDGRHLDVRLIKDGRVVYARNFTPEDCNAIGKIYVPLAPYARLGERVILRVQAIGVEAQLPASAGAPRGETALFYGRVTTPVIFDRDLPDGRIFRNVAEVPRFHPVSRLRRMSKEEMLARTDFDYAEEAVVAPGAKVADVKSTDARIERLRYSDSLQQLDVRSSAPWFLASSEKLTPELRIKIDGRDATPVAINVLFAGVEVPAGKHTIRFERRIGRGWWPVSGVGVLLFVVISVSEILSAAKDHSRRRAA
jgi:hypothetical protein